MNKAAEHRWLKRQASIAVARERLDEAHWSRLGRWLRDLAELINEYEAIHKAQHNDGVDVETTRPIALELVAAYEQCTALYPTLPEVREVFKARKESGKHEFPWPSDRYARRLLGSLDLQLRAAKRGAPHGTRRPK